MLYKEYEDADELIRMLQMRSPEVEMKVMQVEATRDLMIFI